MALITRFETPGKLRDLPASSSFYDEWHRAVTDMIKTSTESRPGDVSPPGSGFYNASLTDVEKVATRSLVWMGFPRPLFIADHPGGRREAFRTSETRGNFRPGGRTTQVEYLEWFAERDDHGRIAKVTFTTESPEYWKALFRAPGGSDRVLELYRELLGNPAIALSEITDASGQYDPLNQWNTTRGIIHHIVAHDPELSTPQNLLGAALGLGGRAVFLPTVSDNFQTFNDSPTAADPRVTNDVSALARKGLQITAADPIGIYLGGWDDTGWSKPDGSPVGDYWKIVRPAGASGPPALRLVYEVPASEGFVVGDIRIGGRPIEFGGQIAEHLTVLFPAVAGKLP
ncbi:MAG: hypothetical protein QOF14_4683 [Hyphomicrobiales bacterium]|jgi:hypothetical protein|nr:hypothetical protein [Hyphomicrobiales bacterium]